MYVEAIVNPSSRVSLVPNITKKCWRFYVAEAGHTCLVIVANTDTSSNIFSAANPSMRAADGYDARLQIGRAYYVSPTQAWDATELTVSPNLPTALSTTKPSTTLNSAASTHAPRRQIHLWHFQRDCCLFLYWPDPKAHLRVR